jgi:hypothetical protein
MEEAVKRELKHKVVPLNNDLTSELEVPNLCFDPR